MNFIHVNAAFIPSWSVTRLRWCRSRHCLPTNPIIMSPLHLSKCSTHCCSCDGASLGKMSSNLNAIIFKQWSIGSSTCHLSELTWDKPLSPANATPLGLIDSAHASPICYYKPPPFDLKAFLCFNLLKNQILFHLVMNENRLSSSSDYSWSHHRTFISKYSVS